MLLVKDWVLVVCWTLSALPILLFRFIAITPEIATYYSDMLQNAAAFVSCYLCYRTAFAFAGGNPMRRVWLLFGSGMAAWGLGGLIYSAYMMLHGNVDPPYPYYGDIGFLAMILLFIAGLLLFKITIGLVTPLWGKGLAVLVFLAALYFAFAMENFSEQGLSLVASAFYSLLDPLLFAMAILIFSGLFGGHVAKAWWFMVAGIALYFVANEVYAYLEFTDAYETGASIDTLWVLGFASIAVSAMITYNQFTGRAER